MLLFLLFLIFFLGGFFLVLLLLYNQSPGLQYKDFASNDAIDDYMAKPQHRDTSPIGFAFGGSSSVVTFLYNKTNTGLNVPAGLNFVTNALGE